MKLLMIFAEKFAFKTTKKGLENAPTVEEKADFANVLVGFIQVEAEDEENAKGAETKLVKNLKWAAKKNGTNKVILHSFNHLSESKANPEFSQELLSKAFERMKNAGYETYQTPFGYFLDLEVKAPGNSLARIFKSF